MLNLLWENALNKAEVSLVETSVLTQNIWRVPVYQRHWRGGHCTGERGSLRSSGSHAWPEARKSCQTCVQLQLLGAARSLFMYMTSATTNVLTYPVPLPSRCFHLPVPFAIHFWKPEVPEGRYQIEKYSSLLPPTTNSVAEKRSDGQKNRGFESRRECTVTHKPLSPMYRLMLWRAGLVSLPLIHKQVLFFSGMLRDSRSN